MGNKKDEKKQYKAQDLKRYFLGYKRLYRQSETWHNNGIKIPNPGVASSILAGGILSVDVIYQMEWCE
jgi:hypothetical protein